MSGVLCSSGHGKLWGHSKSAPKFSGPLEVGPENSGPWPRSFGARGHLDMWRTRLHRVAGPRGPGPRHKELLKFATLSLLVHDTPDLVRGHAKFPVVVFGYGERLSFPAASRSRSSSRPTGSAEARSYVRGCRTRTQAPLRHSYAVARRRDIGQPSCAVRTRDPVAVWLVRARCPKSTFFGTYYWAVNNRVFSLDAVHA